MRRARSQKTSKSVAKRFKITGTGKMMRNRPGKRHLMECKSPRRRRRLGTDAEVAPGDQKRLMKALPFGI